MLPLLGFQPYGNELQSFKKSTELKSATVTVDEDIISQKTVYSTVRCQNNAGLFSTATSDGVTISEIPPSSENAVITIIPQSITEYSSGDNYQQDKTSVRMKWSGFVDQFGIMSFVVSILRVCKDARICLFLKIMFSVNILFHIKKSS